MVQINIIVPEITLVPCTELSVTIPELPSIGGLIFKNWRWQKTSTLSERIAKITTHPKCIKIETFRPTFMSETRNHLFCWLEQSSTTPNRIVLKMGDFEDCDLLNRDTLKEVYVCRGWTRAMLAHIKAGVTRFEDGHAIMFNGERAVITENLHFDELSPIPTGAFAQG